MLKYAPDLLRAGAARSCAAPVAVVVCPAGWSVSPERLFNRPPEEIYVVQGDFGTVSAELLASLEWAAAGMGAKLCILLGCPEIRADLEIQMAPYGMQVVNGVVGPNEVVRFEPPVHSGRLF